MDIRESQENEEITMGLNNKSIFGLAFAGVFLFVIFNASQVAGIHVLSNEMQPSPLGEALGNGIDSFSIAYNKAAEERRRQQQQQEERDAVIKNQILSAHWAEVEKIKVSPRNERIPLAESQKEWKTKTGVGEYCDFFLKYRLVRVYNDLEQGEQVEWRWSLTLTNRTKKKLGCNERWIRFDLLDVDGFSVSCDTVLSNLKIGPKQEQTISGIWHLPYTEIERITNCSFI